MREKWIYFSTLLYKFTFKILTPNDNLRLHVPPYNFKTTLSKTVPLFAKVYSKVTFFLSAYWGGGKNHYPTLLQTFKVSHVLDLFSVWRNFVSIPESERVVGLKPGFNSKTIQTNTPPPLRPPSLPPSIRPYNLSKVDHLCIKHLFFFVFLILTV